MWPMKQSKITIFEYEATAAFLCLVWSIGNMTAALEFEIFYKITVKIDEMFPFQLLVTIRNQTQDQGHRLHQIKLELQNMFLNIIFDILICVFLAISDLWCGDAKSPQCLKLNSILSLLSTPPYIRL